MEVRATILSIVVIPILLLHGYSEDSHVWNSWKSWLTADSFNHIYIPIFKDDQCGNVGDHAVELGRKIDRILHDTGSKKVNIVAHSKGGLDARWYIAHTSPDKVANLIMIATPNAGTAAAYIDLTSCAFTGSAGLGDLQPDSNATQATDNQTTHYFTIAGNFASPCYFILQRICNVVDSDGLVTVDSVQSTNYTSLGIFYYNHAELLTHKDVYQKVLSIIR